LTWDGGNQYFSTMPTKFSRAFLACGLGLLTGCVLVVSWSCAAAEKDAEVQIKDQNGVLRVEIGGSLFTEYHYSGGPRPYLYPIQGPGGVMMTRHWPLKEVGDEERDHPHHKSLWFTHGDVNGVDFWADGTNKGTIVHAKFSQIRSGRKQGVVKEQNRWMTPKGRCVLTEERVFRFYGRGTARILDFDTTLQAMDEDVVLGDTKEGSMAIRVAETMRLKGAHGSGHIVNSEGVRDADTWGKRAAWCDYYGPAENRLVGVAIFDHPANPRHPTWWHVRDYGLFAANPFGIHDFEKKPAGAGNLKIQAGKSITFRYRFYFHDGDERTARVADYYQEYSRGKIHP
jgi:hypothetical protein